MREKSKSNVVSINIKTKIKSSNTTPIPDILYLRFKKSERRTIKEMTEYASMNIIFSPLTSKFSRIVYHILPILSITKP